MEKPVSALTLQFLEWIASSPRTYAQAMEAWRTSCPRMSIWEDALLGGLIQVTSGPSGTMSMSHVRLTESGWTVLIASRASNGARSRHQSTDGET